MDAVYDATRQNAIARQTAGVAGGGHGGEMDFKGRVIAQDCRNWLDRTH